jgi:rare lipoprotein A
MANGKALKDDALTCASWDYPFGTVLRIIRSSTGKSVEVVVTDRGPGKGPRARGVIVDLAKGAFARIAPLGAGIVAVDVERV